MTGVRYLLFYDYVADVVERRGPYRDGHLDHAKEWKAAGKLTSAGALGTPPTGAMFVFDVADAAELEEFVSNDPYVRNGLVTGHRIVPWNVVV